MELREVSKIHIAPGVNALDGFLTACVSWGISLFTHPVKIT